MWKHLSHYAWWAGRDGREGKRWASACLALLNYKTLVFFSLPYFKTLVFFSLSHILNGPSVHWDLGKIAVSYFLILVSTMFSSLCPCGRRDSAWRWGTSQGSSGDWRSVPVCLCSLSISLVRATQDPDRQDGLTRQHICSFPLEKRLQETSFDPFCSSG